ncbi:MAG: hypothetical protein NVSMB46_07170 [Candidatus Saccharimonadales bacterium]
MLDGFNQFKNTTYRIVDTKNKRTDYLYRVKRGVENAIIITVTMYAIILSFIALASLLTWYLLKHDHGRKLPIETLWIAFGFGILGMILAGALELKLFPRQFWIAPQSVSLGARFLFFLGIGALEESAKFIPLALYIFHKPYFKEHTDGIIYFAICGLTFGLGENILYTLSLGAKAGIGRLLMTPFFHAAATSIIGYYLASYKLNNFLKYRFILACIAVPLLHGIYDFGLFSGIAQLTVVSLMITVLFTLGLFLYFMEANDLDKAKLATIFSLSRSQHFCIKCGHPYNNNKRFCEFCGMYHTTN